LIRQKHLILQNKADVYRPYSFPPARKDFRFYMVWIGLPAQGYLLTRLPIMVLPMTVALFTGFRSLHGCGAAEDFHLSSLASSHMVRLLIYISRHVCFFQQFSIFFNIFYYFNIKESFIGLIEKHCCVKLNYYENNRGRPVRA